MKDPVKGTLITAPAGQGATASAVPTGSSDPFTITVDGKTITVAYPNISSGRKLEYSRFGSYADFTSNKATVFSIGDIVPAEQMPTTGQAVYNGLAAASTNGGVGKFNTGTSAFNVDFGAKTVNGIVSVEAKTAALEGKISGGSFSGVKDGISVEGNFYGPNAAELGGVFNGTQGSNQWIGSFGASKQ